MCVCLQVWVTGELPGHASPAQQEECEEAARGSVRPVQAPGQQRGGHHGREYERRDAWTGVHRMASFTFIVVCTAAASGNGNSCEM